MPKLFRERLQELRAERGWSQADLAHHSALAGVPISGNTISAYESALKGPGRVPKADLIEAFAKTFGVPPETFYEYPIALARQGARATPDSAERARERTAKALREKAQRRNARPEAAPDTKPARRRRKGEGK